MVRKVSEKFDSPRKAVRIVANVATQRLESQPLVSLAEQDLEAKLLDRIGEVKAPLSAIFQA